MCLPSRIGVVHGGIHIAENKFAIGGVEGDQKLVLLEKDGPSRRESSHNQITQFLHIVSRGIVGIDDLVQQEQSLIVPVRKMGPNLRRENVIICIHQGQVLHRCQFGKRWLDLLSVEVVATRGEEKTEKDGNHVVGLSDEVNGNDVSRAIQGHGAKRKVPIQFSRIFILEAKGQRNK